MRLLLFLVCALLLVSCQAPAPPPKSLTVHFIDVGQGAATLLHGPDFAILVDAGRPDGNEVVPYLRARGVRSLDLLVGTHPHADHIGQVPEVLKAFAVKEVWLSGDIAETRTFERVREAVKASTAGYREPRTGEVRTFGSAQVHVLNPTTVTGDVNRGSIVLRVLYGQTAVLLPGDAGIDVEDVLLRSEQPVQAQVVGLAHHGSASSSSMAFLKAIRPEVAVYSASKDNPYGYPHWEIVERTAAAGAKLYGTDVNGTVRVESDGVTIKVTTQRPGVPRSPNKPPVPAGER